MWALLVYHAWGLQLISSIFAQPIHFLTTVDISQFFLKAHFWYLYCFNKKLRHMSDLTCLSKRAILLLLCWVFTFLSYAPSYWEHSCHSKCNMHGPRIFIDWIMNVLLLVLKLFVSSHPLNFEGACHFKNYCLLSLTYSGRAGVKLGDVDTLQTYL